MKKCTILTILGICSVFIYSAIYAGTEVSDNIVMNNKAYAKHKKGIVTFSHKKHIEDYKAGCGECHHDDKGKELNDLKIGDNVQNCIECHKKPSERPKGKGAPKLSKKQKLDYQGWFS